MGEVKTLDSKIRRLKTEIYETKLNNLQNTDFKENLLPSDPDYFKIIIRNKDILVEKLFKNKLSEAEIYTFNEIYQCTLNNNRNLDEILRILRENLNKTITNDYEGENQQS